MEPSLVLVRKAQELQNMVVKRKHRKGEKNDTLCTVLQVQAQCTSMQSTDGCALHALHLLRR